MFLNLSIEYRNARTKRMAMEHTPNHWHERKKPGASTDAPGRLGRIPGQRETPGMGSL